MKDLIYKNIKHGLYEIDEFGNVYSKYKNGFLKPKHDKDGYLSLALSGGKRGNSCFARIATLVIVTYVGLPEKHIKDPTVNHSEMNESARSHCESQLKLLFPAHKAYEALAAIGGDDEFYRR